MHRHPVGVAVAVAVLLAAIGLLIGAVQLWWVVVPPWTWWALRTDAHLADEWRAQERPPATDGGEPPRGAFERAAARQQWRTEEENRIVGAEGNPDEMLSPVVNRFIRVWLVWAAVLVVVGLLWAAGEAIVQPGPTRRVRPGTPPGRSAVRQRLRRRGDPPGAVGRRHR